MNHSLANIPMVLRPNRGCHTHYKKYRYGKELVGLLKEIFLNYFDTIDHKILLEILQEISMMEDLSVWYRIC